MLIEDFEQSYLLEVSQMDDTHREFVELLNALDSADKPGFIRLFGKLLAHTEAHFQIENALMRESGFPAIREHMDEHQRVLGELHRINDKVQGGSVLIGRAYVREQLPGWFKLHAITMDSALAAHLKQQAQFPAFASVILH